MDKLKIYFDNCCYGRPFDDLSIGMNGLEATAKMYIQSLVKFNSLYLYSSFMTFREIKDIPYVSIKENITNYVNEYSSYFISDERKNDVKSISEDIMKTGIKKKDATHLACSIIAECDYFITTDKRVLNYKTDKINIVNPIDFLKIWEETK
ncbi:MAG: hypothetical protein FWG44_00900 [Oscillospiraceae bacterium]|nr:hypothetical protein [Oscillospiraceae bacterium]